MPIKIILTTILIISITLLISYLNNQHPIQQQFQLYKSKYQKQYHIGEQSYRRYIYYGNKIKIEGHNSRKEKSYQMEINVFADLTELEFREMYLGLKVERRGDMIIQKDFEEEARGQNQIVIDWQQEGRISRVKNQKMCASCWAFSVVGAIESAYMIKGINQSFSEQQLVDCSTSYGNNGCHGGQLVYTYDYILKKGITTEQQYPYIGKDQNCKKTKGQFHISGYTSSITCSGLYISLLKGPVSVAVDANQWGFYKDGIYDECGNEVNHGVLLIGVTADYWRIKNSWGAEWGNNGFMKLKKGNTCSICQYQFYPTLS